MAVQTKRWLLKDQFWNDDCYWMRQIIQNSCALYLGIPLQIYSIEKAKKLPELFKKYFPNQDFDQTINEILKIKDGKIKGIEWLKTEQWKDFFNEYYHNASPWITSISNPHPFLKFFQNLGKEYDCWLQLFYYHHLILQPTSNKILSNEVIINDLFTKDIGKCLKWGYIKFDSNFYLVSSFIWKSPTSKRNDTYFEQTCIKNTIEVFKKVFSNKAVFPISKSKSLQPLFEWSFKKRLEQAQSVLKWLLTAEIEFAPEMLRRYHCTMLARIGLFLHKAGVKEIIKKLLPKKRLSLFASPSLKLFYKIDFAKSFEDENKVDKKIENFFKEKYPDALLSSAWVEINIEKDKYQIALRKSQPCLSFNKSNDHYWFYCQEVPQDAYNSLELEWSEFLTKMRIGARFYEHHILVSILEKLHSYWEVIALPIEQDRPIWSSLLEEISCLLTADFGVLYKYNPGEDTLEPLSTYIRPPLLTQKEREIWQDGLIDLMKRAADDTKNDKKRKKSISYRAFDENEPQFTRFYDVKEDIPIPPDSPLLISLDDTLLKQKGRLFTSMAVPLCIAGRPFSILEVGGLHPFQFRWANLQLLTRLTEVIAPFLFQEKFLKEIEGMTRIVFESPAKPQTKFNKICKHLAELFACFAVTIWLRDEDRETRFVCCGCYNRDQIKKKIAKKEIYYEENEKDSYSARLVREQGDWLQINLKEIEKENPNWFKQKPHRQDLKDSRFKHLLIFPIKGQKEKILGTVSLYSKRKEHFSEDCLPMIKFISKYLALLIETMQAQVRFKRSVYNILVHQIKHHVTSLYERAISLQNIISKMPLDDKTASRVELLGKGLAYSNRDARDMISILSKAVTTEEGAEEELISYGSLLTRIDPALLTPYLISQRKKEKIDLKQILEQVISNKYHLKQKRHLEIKKDTLPEAGPYVLIHKENLQLLLENLLDNALKYALEGTEIKIEWQEKTYGAYLSVSNQGRCLEKGEQYYIFKKGFQGKNAEEIEKEEDKTPKGLGLYIAKNVAAFYGIGIYYMSKLLNNNQCLHTFTLDFPKIIIQRS